MEIRNKISESLVRIGNWQWKFLNSWAYAISPSFDREKVTFLSRKSTFWNDKFEFKISRCIDALGNNSSNINLIVGVSRKRLKEEVLPEILNFIGEES